jgi:hypothetical protein
MVIIFHLIYHSKNYEQPLLAYIKYPIVNYVNELIKEILRNNSEFVFAQKIYETSKIFILNYTKNTHIQGQHMKVRLVLGISRGPIHFCLCIYI